MRAPTSLDDRDPLQDEPFATVFSARPNRRKKPLSREVLDKISDLLEKDAGHYTAVENWLKLAFEPDESYRKRDYKFRRQNGGRKHSRKALKYFVNFYWYLFCGHDPMEVLRSQNLEGYVNTTRKVPRFSVKREPFDEPMSPLTDLEDDDGISPFAAAQDEVVMLQSVTEAQCRSGEPIGIAVPTFPIKDEELTVSLVLEPSQNVLMAPAFPADAGVSTAPGVFAAEPTLESESLDSVRTPVRSKIIVASKPPTGRKRGPGHPSKASAAPKLPAAELPLLPPAERRRGPGRLPRARPAPELPAAELPLLPRPLVPFGGTSHASSALRQSHIRDQQFLIPNHRPRVEVPSSQLYLIKPEPLEEESERLRLFTAADTQENWLNMPARDELVHGGHESESFAPTLIIESPVVNPKLHLRRLPPIWAQARQEVCESFEWFRSYQGGVYQNNGTVKGYLLSGYPAQRDCFECDGKLIISHGGGKADSSRRQRGQTTNTTADDQRLDDLSVRALLENYRTGQPLVLLIDDKYEPFPFDLAGRNVYMAVLGFYRIIHTWAEFQSSSSNSAGRVVRYKFAFQWCEGQGEPWWSRQDSNDSFMSDELRTEVPAPQRVPKPAITSPLKPANLYTECTECSKSSPRVFNQTWACLNPRCRVFWTANGVLLPAKLDYNPAFLSVIDFRPLPVSHRDTLLPKPPVLTPTDGVTTTYAYSRGWHCRKCGRLSCRSAWEHYKCPYCSDTHKVVANIRPAKGLISIPVPISNKFADSLIDDQSGIVLQPMRLFNRVDARDATGRCQTFVLPDGKGKIHLIQTNRLGNAEADRIFEAYQQQASDGTLLFRRWPLRSHKLRGTLLTNYFSQNSGETYHYVGGTDNTVPFDRAPRAVVQARALIQKRMYEALGMNYAFNEVLSAAYMEQQKMAFHSDSERGLGPVVAGLSMGSPALMHFRVLSKFVPHDQQRANVLTVVLRHGDVLVMDGAGVQDFYEHTVVPCNFRIAATARYISPGHT